MFNGGPKSFRPNMSSGGMPRMGGGMNSQPRMGGGMNRMNSQPRMGGGMNRMSSQPRFNSGGTFRPQSTGMFRPK